MQQPQSYRPEEIQEIIKLAVTREAYDGELSRQHLVEIAQELGISEHSLQLAERDWMNDRIVLEKKNKLLISIEKEYSSKKRLNIY